MDRTPRGKLYNLSIVPLEAAPGGVICNGEVASVRPFGPIGISKSFRSIEPTAGSGTRELEGHPKGVGVRGLFL